MKIIGNVYTFIIGTIAFIGMLLLSQFRGLYIIASAGLKRLLPARLLTWVFPVSLVLIATVFTSYVYVKDANRIVRLVYGGFFGVATIVGLVATIQDGVRWVISFFKSEATVEEKPNGA